MIKRWLYVTLFPAIACAYLNPLDCDFENDPCSWSIEGSRRISYNQSKSTGGWTDHTNQNDCHFFGGLYSWDGNEWSVNTTFNYTVTECKSPRDHSVLTSKFEICPGEKCLSFKYQTKDFQREDIYVDVQALFENQWSQVWKSGWQKQFKEWKEIRADINLRNKSRIAIRFAHTNCSNATYYISNISIKKQSCSETTTIFTASPTTVIPTTTSIDNITNKITTPSTIIDATTIVTVSSTKISRTGATSISARVVITTSSPTGKLNYSANVGVIIGLVIGCLALVVVVSLVAVYLYRRRRVTSPRANKSKNRTVSCGTFSGASRTKTDNGKTRRYTERLSQTSETMHHNAQAEDPTVQMTQRRQSRNLQGSVIDIISIDPCHSQLQDKHGNNVTYPGQTHDQYYQSADKDGTNSYNTMHNHTTEFHDATYDSTSIYPMPFLDSTYDHTSFKRNLNNTYDHTNLTQVNTCDTTLQLSMHDFDPTYDHL